MSEGVDLNDLPRRPPERPGTTAAARIGVSAAAGIVVAVPFAALTTWALLPLVAWDTACVVFLLWVWLGIWRLDAEQTAQAAVPDDPTRTMAQSLLLGAAVASLVAVGFVLKRASSSQGAEQLGLAALGVASVALSWGVVHTIYTLRYAYQYYTGGDGGIDFNQDEPPRYSDFAYLAFTIGMTFQVSDTDLKREDIRRSALKQGLLSFVFSTGIVATTINLLANLG